MSDNWNFYLDELDGYLASFVVDLEVTEEINIKKYKKLFSVRINLKNPTEQSYPEEQEDDRIGEWEYDLMERLNNEDIVQVGRLTTNGIREFFYYANTDKKVKIIEQHAKALFDNNNYETEIKGIEEDEPWEFYFEFLYPNEYQFQHMSNHELVEILENEKDDLEVPRKIEHWVEFETLEDLKLFERDIQQEGFITEGYEQEKNEDGTYSITISREDGVDYHLIDSVTDTVIEMAQKHNGEYDGWESPVIQKKL
ncbi:DUF695 domain-containing protein [Fictibacillus nanhaiensis]|uniref:DUF695 domain-containing protein n=1 Tax=Fictibacillus nanhaiensis TaxID=742169 RepID=UPI001C95A0E8|nr:DUF695 domain-containing protein [Fictibacillus nanhaiensis]MBY6038063.1 DUF695 domain-containing protein [Fictibacillus nanhaiensis]